MKSRSNKVEHKRIEFKVEGTTEEGVFTGVGSGFGNIDKGGDIVAPGAFDEFLQNNPPNVVKCLWQHEQSMSMGYYRELQPAGDGLRVQGKILPTTLGKDALILMRGDKLGKGVDGLSIGYIVREHKFEMIDGRRIRVILKADLIEISVVTFPMNTKCRIDGVKKMTVEEIEELKSLNDIQDLLRDNGFSKNAAVGLIAKIGEFKRISDEGKPPKEKAGIKPQGKPVGLNEGETEPEEEEEEIEESGITKKPTGTNKPDNTFPAQKEQQRKSEEACKQEEKKEQEVKCSLDALINELTEMKG